MWEEFQNRRIARLPRVPSSDEVGNSVHFEEFNPWLDIWVEINAYPPRAT